MLIHRAQHSEYTVVNIGHASRHPAAQVSGDNDSLTRKATNSTPYSSIGARVRISSDPSTAALTRPRHEHTGVDRKTVGVGIDPDP